MNVFLVLAIANLITWLVLTTYWVSGMRRVRVLKRIVPPPECETYPTLSVIIPALNEASTLEAGLETVLAQDYPGLEITVINDRSSDGTGEVLTRLGATYPQLNVVHVDTLPVGWLGKNHALQLGADASTGDWLLFSDADIHHQPETFRRAVAFAERERLDHLALLPDFVTKGWLLTSFVAVFSVFLSIIQRPWEARNPRSGAHIGVGAFNLVRARVYRAVGGHHPIAMRPDDDLKLGKLIKRAGYRQEAVFGTGLEQVEWYPGLAEAVRGLNKNFFAGFEYSLVRVAAAISGIVLANILPFVAVFFTTGVTQLLFAATIAVAAVAYHYHQRMAPISAWYVLLHPVGALLVGYSVLEATIKTLASGGISWRGTPYALEALKKNKV